MPTIAAQEESGYCLGSVLQITVQDTSNALSLLEQAGFETPALFGRRLHIMSRDPDTDRSRISSIFTERGIKSSFLTTELSMDDVFVHWVRRLESEGQSHESGLAA